MASSFAANFLYLYYIFKISAILLEPVQYLTFIAKIPNFERKK